MAKKIYILSGVLSVLILVNIFFIFSFPKQELAQGPDSSRNYLGNSQAYIFPISEPSYVPVLDTAIERPLLNAKSAIVYDTRSSRFLYSKNPNERLPIASLTKLLNAVVVFENINLNDVIVIPKEALKVDGEKQTLYLDEKIKAKDLMKMMLIESSNDAAYAFKYYASGLGIDLIGLMNKKAAEIGMSDSIFHDPAGLNDEALSTADDLVRLVTYSLQFQGLWEILGEKADDVYSVDGGISHRVSSTNRLLGILPDIIGGKTGYTDGALGCIILVIDIPNKNDKVVGIILGSKERFSDMEKLMNWVKRAYSWD